jgi:hypothetical protein
VSFVPIVGYGISSKANKIKKVYEQYLTEYQKLNAGVCVKMMHFIHFKSQQGDEESLFKEE